MSFKPISGKLSGSLNFDNRSLLIYLALPHFLSDTVTNRLIFSSAKAIEPVYYPGVWELGHRFLVVSCEPRYPITVSTKWVASLTNFCVAATEHKPSTKVLNVAAITWSFESH